MQVLKMGPPPYVCMHIHTHVHAHTHYACLGGDRAGILLNETGDESIRNKAMQPNPAQWSRLGYSSMQRVWIVCSLSGRATEAETTSPGDQTLHWKAGGGREETLAHHCWGWRREGEAEEGVGPGRSSLSPSAPPPPPRNHESFALCKPCLKMSSRVLSL